MTVAGSAATAVRAVVDWLAGVAPASGRLSADSRAIEPGDVFFAWPGEHHDGRRFIDAAIAHGASAVLVEAGGDGAGGEAARESVAPVRAVAGLREAAGPIASAWYGEPTGRLSVVAVTGTNGKTSCTHWIAEGCNRAAAAPAAAVIGTLGAGIPGALDPTGLTTPDALSLQRAFACFAADGRDVVAIEASSIGLAQGRLNGTRIAVAVLTNLTRDHLDYHGSMQAYADAKARLFAWPDLGAAVINLEDPLSALLLQRIAPQTRCIGYLVDDSAADPVAAARTEAALARADRCDELLIATPGSAPGPASGPASGAASEASSGAGPGEIVLTHVVRPQGDDDLPATAGIDVGLTLLGRFNRCNALAVAGAWRALGWPLERIAAQLAELRPVPGRLEVVGAPADAAAAGAAPLVVVDYAHTPDALTNALGALRPIAGARGGRLWCVFGAGGDRDPGKRPLMAAAVEALADRLVVTSDNPRSEAPDVIIAGLLAGLDDARPVQVEPDRAAAIGMAIAAAAAADVVLIAGKGHETYQEIGGIRHPFSDAAVAAEALRVRDAGPAGGADV